jgi:hypothetical protein
LDVLVFLADKLAFGGYLDEDTVLGGCEGVERGVFAVDECGFGATVYEDFADFAVDEAADDVEFCLFGVLLDVLVVRFDLSWLDELCRVLL